LSLYDNEVIAAIVSRLEGELLAWPWTSNTFTVGVQQKQQPTQQGREDEPTIFIEKLFDKAHGFAKVTYTPHETNTHLVLEEELQVYTVTYQFCAACTQDPRDTYRPTASDLCDIARMILQRRSAIRYFQALGINLLRVPEVRNSYFTNEQDRQEAMPSFDLTVSYTRKTPAAELGRIEFVTDTIVQV